MSRGMGIGLSAFLLLVMTSTAQAGKVEGIGVLGDSYSDEYQFYPPDRTTARNWVEILAATRGLNFGQFLTQPRSEPRNQGFEFNWARSDATTDDMIGQGQHTGLAAQVARGQVKYVIIFVGGNDYIGVLKNIDPWAALASVEARAQQNFALALRTILEAHSDVRVLAATLPDVCDLPEFRAAAAQGRLPRGLSDAVSRSILRYNAGIYSLAARERRVAVVDLFLTGKLMNLLAGKRLVMSGQTVDRLNTGNDLGHLFLNDYRHLGTVGQGLFAKMMIQGLNARFGAGIEPLQDAEIVTFARSVPRTRLRQPWSPPLQARVTFTETPLVPAPGRWLPAAGIVMLPTRP